MRILVAEDMEINRRAVVDEIKKILPEAEVDAFKDGRYAWEAAQKGRYDLVITDIMMHFMHGDELAAKIHGLCPNIPILFETGESQSVLLERGIQLERCIYKPVRAVDIKTKLDELGTLPPFTISIPPKMKQEKPEMSEPQGKGIFRAVKVFFAKNIRKKPPEPIAGQDGKEDNLLAKPSRLMNSCRDG